MTPSHYLKQCKSVRFRDICLREVLWEIFKIPINVFDNYTFKITIISSRANSLNTQSVLPLNLSYFFNLSYDLLSIYSDISGVRFKIYLLPLMSSHHFINFFQRKFALIHLHITWVLYIYRDMSTVNVCVICEISPCNIWVTCYSNQQMCYSLKWK